MLQIKKKYVYFQYHIRKWKLSILNLEKMDEGQYTCVLENTQGILNFTFKIEVLQCKYNLKFV